MKMLESKRITLFKKFLSNKTINRKNIIESFFKSTFFSWENYFNKNKIPNKYVGYSPSIGIDAPKIIKDFSDCKIIHVIRNPFSAYRDTKRRPFPQNIEKYLIIWNLYHSTCNYYSRLYPKNFKIIRYEDFVEDKCRTMHQLSNFIDINYSKELLVPSWNSQPLDDNISPWGTVLKCSKEYNSKIIGDLSKKEVNIISNFTKPLAQYFNYDKIDYLKKYYA
jgi:hypothetical protein